MINGVINVYKEKGFTSHDVVAKLRGIIKQKKIGHTGTLDPDAVGVLPVCLGNATKLCDFLTDKKKEYVAEILLGVTTDTQDMTGKILKESEVTVTESEVEEVLFSFLGKSKQIPPMYSAVKVNGKRLYELAREGKEIERKPREIEIYEIDIEQMKLPLVKFRIQCSKGTYIRTICHDIGQKLSCGAAMQSLIRTGSGEFLLKDSLTLKEIENLNAEGMLRESIINVDVVLREYPACYIKNSYKFMLQNGNSFADINIKAVDDDTMDVRKFRVYDEDKCFYGIYEFYEKDRRYKPVKMFLDNNEIKGSCKNI